MSFEWRDVALPKVPQEQTSDEKEKGAPNVRLPEIASTLAVFNDNPLLIGIVAHQLHFVCRSNLFPIVISLPASRMMDRSQVCPASEFMRGCHAIRYLNVPNTGGALSILRAGLLTSNSATRLGTVATRFVPMRHRIATVW